MEIKFGREYESKTEARYRVVSLSDAVANPMVPNRQKNVFLGKRIGTGEEEEVKYYFIRDFSEVVKDKESQKPFVIDGEFKDFGHVLIASKKQLKKHFYRTVTEPKEDAETIVWKSIDCPAPFRLFHAKSKEVKNKEAIHIALFTLNEIDSKLIHERITSFLYAKK